MAYRFRTFGIDPIVAELFQHGLPEGHVDAVWVDVEIGNANSFTFPVNDPFAPFDEAPDGCASEDHFCFFWSLTWMRRVIARVVAT